MRVDLLFLLIFQFRTNNLNYKMKLIAEFRNYE